ncbi:phage tail tape measure protein [Pseudomonas asplenii]|uniref:phage tail tape measure protein n=1 Tax=Pseudomonas asplenii TaxID=53407 RepID=UPI0006B54330|nr:phage tail tape measure protein [Pseudomonas fuscovaginae]KPA98092.1 phage tail tape measure protein, lambda family [Pseudomonas fuscovaginae]
MAVDSLGQLTVDLIANTGGFERGMDRAERKLKSTAREAKYQAGQLEKLVGQIDPVVGAYGRLDKMEEQLRKHRAAGRLDQEDFTEYLKKLNEQRAAIGANDAAMAKGGMSAKAYAAALRGVPAQFTDIAVSLQGGQAPLTVFLQQGGQLKDMFGGIGPAAKALGGYVLGLVNPFTVAAAAGAVLALAYKQGSDEGTAFTASLAETGNTAGTTASSLSSLARQVAQAGGTVGKASEVLAQLAGSTRIPVSAFESIAAAAIKYESATGLAAEKTVENFERIAKDPVSEILKLNESMNFLTASTYEHIRSLQEQGKIQDAASVATAAYADGLNRTSTTIKENLGYIETGWNTVKAAAKGAWDAMLNVGRETTLDQKLAELDDKLKDLASRKTSPLMFEDNPNLGELAGGEEALQRQKTELLVQKAEQDRRAAAKGFAQQQQQQSVDDQVKLDKLRRETESNAEKRARELADYRLLVERRVTQARATGDKGLLISAEQQAKDIAAINEKYKDPAVKKTPQYREDAGTKALDQAKQQYAALQQQQALIGDQAAASQTLGANAKKLVEWEQQLADIKAKKTLTADQKSLLANQEQITAQLKKNAALETENTLREKGLETRRKLAAFDENLKSQLASAQQGLDNNLAGIGLGDVQRQRMQEQQAIRQSYQSQLDKLTSDYNKSNKDQFSTELYDKETAALRSALDQRLAMQQKYYQDVDRAQEDWKNGASEAYDDYMRSARDVAGQTKSLVTNAFNSMDDAVANFALSGKFSFSDFARSVLADMARIAARQASSSVLSSLFGMASSALGSYFGSGGNGLAAGSAGAVSSSAGASAAGYTGDAFKNWSGGYSDGGYTGDGGKYEPKGVVHGGEVVIRKEVVQQPGMRQYLERLNKRGYADGGYVGLDKAASASSTGAGATYSFPISVQVDTSGVNADPAASEKDAVTMGRNIQNAARAEAEMAIRKGLMPGGSIYREIRGR